MTTYREMARIGPVLIEAVIPESTAKEITYMLSCQHRCEDFGHVGIATRAEAERLANAHANQHQA